MILPFCISSLAGKGHRERERHAVNFSRSWIKQLPKRFAHPTTHLPWEGSEQICAVMFIFSPKMDFSPNRPVSWQIHCQTISSYNFSYKIMNGVYIFQSQKSNLFPILKYFHKQCYIIKMELQKQHSEIAAMVATMLWYCFYVLFSCVIALE